MLFCCPICNTQTELDPRVRYLACASCRHMFEYDGEQAKDLGKCPIEPDPDAILRIGDKGHIRGRPFEVVATLYISEAPEADPLTYTTQWVIRLNDGRIATLDIYDDELYYEAGRTESLFNMPPFEALTIGDVINVNGQSLRIEELTVGILVGLEGATAYARPKQALKLVTAYFRNYEAYIEYAEGQVFISYAMAFPLTDLVVEPRASSGQLGG